MSGPLPGMKVCRHVGNPDTCTACTSSAPVVHKFIYRQRVGERTTLCAQDNGVQTTVSTDRTWVTCPKCALLMTEDERDQADDVQSPMSRRRDLDTEAAGNAGSSPVGESS